MPHNDIIIGYIIYCNTSANQAYPEQRIGYNTPTIRSVVNGTTLAATFSTGLNPYTEYNCYVTANTLVGEGSPSMIGTARTDEGGTCALIVFRIITFIHTDLKFSIHQTMHHFISKTGGACTYNKIMQINNTSNLIVIMKCSKSRTS